MSAAGHGGATLLQVLPASLLRDNAGWKGIIEERREEQVVKAADNRSLSFVGLGRFENENRVAGRSLSHGVRNGSAGFTLVEAVIAMLVTVVGLVALVGTFAIAMKTNSSSQNLTTATSLAQDRLEQLETIAFQRLADPSRMMPNPNSKGTNDTLMVGSLESNVRASDGTYYYDKVILAGPHEIEPEGTIVVVRPDGTAETRRPNGTVHQGSPFPADRVTYSRRWVILSSTEPDPVDRRLTVAVRVKN